MISGCGSPPASIRSAAASRIARACMANSPGIDDAEPHAAQAEHRVLLVQPLDRARAACGARFLRWPRSSASATSTESSVRSGRNSCSGGSISRIVTGSPSIASRISVKSSRCSGSSAASAASCPSSSSATIRFSTSWRRSPRNMCSVRHSPMPCGAEPPGPGGVLGGVGVGAHLAAARARRRAPSVAATAVDQRRRRPPRPRSSAPRTSRPTGTAPAKTSPVVPSMEMTSPSFSGPAAADGDSPLVGVDVERLGAAHAGAAHAAGDDGGVRGLAAAAGQDAAGGHHARAGRRGWSPCGPG